MGMRTDKYMRQKRRLFQRSKTMPICHSTNQTLQYTYTCCCVFFSLYQSQGRVRKSISYFISHNAESRENRMNKYLKQCPQVFHYNKWVGFLVVPSICQFLLKTPEDDYKVSQKQNQFEKISRWERSMNSQGNQKQFTCCILISKFLTGG